MKTVREILEELVSKPDMDLDSVKNEEIDQALLEIKEVIVPEEKKLKFNSTVEENQRIGFNQCRTEVLTKWGVGKMRYFMVMVLCLMLSGCQVRYESPKPEIKQFTDKTFKDDHFVCGIYTGIFYKGDCVWSTSSTNRSCSWVDSEKRFQEAEAEKVKEKIIKAIILED